MMNTSEARMVQELVAMARFHAIAQCNDSAAMCARDAEKCFVEKADYEGAMFFATRALKHLFGGPLTDEL